MFATVPQSPGDGGEWTVSEDWEQARGIVYDLFMVDSTDSSALALRERFEKEPLFLEIVNTILDLDRERPIRDKHRAGHCTKFFFIRDGKLWRVPNNSSTRVHSRLECIMQAEAVEMARQEHRSRGHWGRDMIKLQLMDHIYSPHLDRSIATAI
ncbi:hypothetical protein BV22DRAFT_1023468, partial [Leucogyrophana mollusca]